MLQRIPPMMERHNAAMELSDRRALQLQAQHPQRQGAGKMRKSKHDMDNTPMLEVQEGEEHDGNLKGGAHHSAPASRLARLVGGRKAPSKKQLEDIGKNELILHQKEHEAMEDDAHQQGGMLSRHLREKYGDEHSRLFGSGFISDLNIPVLSGLAGIFGLGKPHKNPKELGKMMAEHLHGSGFWDDFKSGFMSVIRPVASIAKPLLAIAPHPAAKAASLGLSALGLGKARGRPRKMAGGNVDILTGAVDTGRVADPPPSFERNTVGMGAPTGHPSMRHNINTVAGGAYTGGMDGSGKKRRAKAGVSDARKRRGAEVSRLMREKGMTLGEASKHIKEHGY